MMATSSSESESDIEPTCGLDGLDMKIVEKRETRGGNADPRPYNAR